MEYQSHNNLHKEKFSEDIRKIGDSMTSSVDIFGFAYKAIHVGQEPDSVHGGVTPALHLSTTFAQKQVGQLYSNFDYSRCGNPTREILQKQLGALEFAEYCQVFSSGVGALSSFFGMFQTGDHFICCDDVYGGTQRYLRQIATKNFGFQVDYIDLTDLKLVEQSIKPNTKAMWIETPTNPTLKICDIKALCEIAKKNNIITVVDNTFCSPALQSPILLGADFVNNSMTKYIGGHADILMGSMTTNNKELNDRLYFNVKSMGAVPSPFECYLAIRSLKTLRLRMEQHCKNGMAVAQYLESHPAVQRVFYPGLKSHPQHAIALKQMRNFSGMITFYIKGGLEQSKKFAENLHVFCLAESLGGVESLCEIPSLMTHGSVPLEQRKKLGIEDNLIRLSCGIEDVEYLLNDLQTALKISQE